MAVRVKHGTLTATTVATVTLTQLWNEVEVVNRGSDFIYASTTNNAPTVAGDDIDVVPPGSVLTLIYPTQLWEQGADYNIYVSGSFNTGSGQTVTLSQMITTSIPTGSVFTFTGGGTLTLTANANNGDRTLTGDVATAAITGTGNLTQATTTNVYLISASATPYSVCGLPE